MKLHILFSWIMRAEHWRYWVTFWLVFRYLKSKGKHKWQRSLMAGTSWTNFLGQTKHLAKKRKNLILGNLSMLPVPFFLLGGGRGDESCFDADAVRGLAREDSKHCLCRTFKINPSATGLTTPLVSLPLSLTLPFPKPFFLSPLSVMCLLLSENRGST